MNLPSLRSGAARPWEAAVERGTDEEHGESTQVGARRSFWNLVLHLGRDRQYHSDLHHAADEALWMDAHPSVGGADGLFADHGFGRAPGGLGPGSNRSALGDDQRGIGTGFRTVPCW